MFPVVIDNKKRVLLSKICPKANKISKEDLRLFEKEWKKQNLPLQWTKAYSTIPID